MPSSKTPVFQAPIKNMRQLTSEDAVKTTLEVTLELSVKYLFYLFLLFLIESVNDLI